MDQLSISGRSSVFKTPWFELIEKTMGTNDAPHYSIRTRDYISVFAVTLDKRFPVGAAVPPSRKWSRLELPGGTSMKARLQEQAARKELREETGFIAEELNLLGTLSPDTEDVKAIECGVFLLPGSQSSAVAFEAERGIEPLVYDKPLRDLILMEPAFCSALNRAAILMAVIKGYIEL